MHCVCSHRCLRAHETEHLLEKQAHSKRLCAEQFTQRTIAPRGRHAGVASLPCMLIGSASSCSCCPGIRLPLCFALLLPDLSPEPWFISPPEFPPEPPPDPCWPYPLVVAGTPTGCSPCCFGKTCCWFSCCACTNCAACNAVAPYVLGLGIGVGIACCVL